MNSLELLDSWISERIRAWTARFSGQARGPELLEIRRELLNDVRDQIRPAGNGRFIFPYSKVRVHLSAASEGQRQLLESAFAQSNDLEQEFQSLLSEAGCRIPQGFSVEVSIIDDAATAALARPFQIDYSNNQVTAARVEVPRPAARLTVLRGDAEPREYLIDSDRAYLGRLKEVVSETGSLRRRNDIAFAESETTVSREHAFISYDAEAGSFRLHDARSQHGTRIFRERRELRAPKGSAQGVELKSGDEIHLGAAQLKFEIGQ